MASRFTVVKPRQFKPELEHSFNRSPKLGYEDVQDKDGVITCLSHGFPTPLARWHFHDEYELHLITETSGKAFVGDYIGPFEPGHLVLCGPRLPHNWISVDLPVEGVRDRDWVVQFKHEPIVKAVEALPELSEVLPLLERAKHGIEFFGLSDRAMGHWNRIRSSKGMERMAAFLEYLSDLARCSDYRLLSNVQMQGAVHDEDTLDLVNRIVDRITVDLSEPMSLSEAAREMDMTDSQFSRFFKKATGNNYSDFVNRIRINRACQLLSDTDKLISDICYEVGFNNVANFNRRFMGVKGLTPSEFRRQSMGRYGVRLNETALTS